MLALWTSTSTAAQSLIRLINEKSVDILFSECDCQDLFLPLSLFIQTFNLETATTDQAGGRKPVVRRYFGWTLSFRSVETLQRQQEESGVSRLVINGGRKEQGKVIKSLVHSFCFYMPKKETRLRVKMSFQSAKCYQLFHNMTFHLLLFFLFLH